VQPAASVHDGRLRSTAAIRGAVLSDGDDRRRRLRPEHGRQVRVAAAHLQVSGAALRPLDVRERRRRRRGRLRDVHVQAARDLPRGHDAWELPGRVVRHQLRGGLRAGRQRLPDLRVPVRSHVRRPEHPLQGLSIRLPHGAERLPQLRVRATAAGLRTERDDALTLGSSAPRHAPSRPRRIAAAPFRIRRRKPRG
jgi:hypothetical protein